ncbi:MAG: SAM-dependent methyltransferase, partial [Endozoicomonas sp.]
LDNYYTPLEKRLPEFLAQHNNSPEAQAIVQEERKEVALYQQYKDYYSYGVYIARKTNHIPS